MVYRGIIRNGRVALSEPLDLPDGTTVSVRAVKGRAARTRSGGGEWAPSNSLGRLLSDFAGAIKDAPPDLAANHDRYIHGTPKRSASSARRNSASNAGSKRRSAR